MPAGMNVGSLGMSGRATSRHCRSPQGRSPLEGGNRTLESGGARRVESLCGRPKEDDMKARDGKSVV